MSPKQIKFKNAAGDILSARIELPINKNPHNYAVFAHCFTCNKNFKAVRYITKALTSEGFGVLSFDFTGLGESEGSFSDTTFSSSVDDLICAANYLENNYKTPSMFIGHSLGGAAVILAASRFEEVRAVVTIGTPSAPQHLKNLLRSGIDEIEKKGSAEVSIGGRPFRIKKQFVDDLNEQNLTEIIKSMRKAYLFMHSPQDKIVGIENAGELYRAARHPKSFISLEKADHLLSKEKDGRYAGKLIADWAGRYVDIREPKKISKVNHVLAHLESEENFTTQISAGQHDLIADEPVKVGGNDFGPSPYDYVSSGLAACTVMTLRMYATHKKWDLQEVFCHVWHEKTHFEDCAECENPKTKIDKFTRRLKFIGDLDDSQKTRLLEIADKCPVHKTLEARAHIETVMIPT